MCLILGQTASLSASPVYWSVSLICRLMSRPLTPEQTHAPCRYLSRFGVAAVRRFVGAGLSGQRHPAAESSSSVSAMTCQRLAAALTLSS